MELDSLYHFQQQHFQGYIFFLRDIPPSSELQGQLAEQFAPLPSLALTSETLTTGHQRKGSKGAKMGSLDDPSRMIETWAKVKQFLSRRCFSTSFFVELRWLGGGCRSIFFDS